MTTTTPRTTEVCFTLYEATSTILIFGGLLSLTVLYHITKYEGIPIQKLGCRPRGSGLFEWFYHYFNSTTSTCVFGYDPIVGSVSPPFRLVTHIAAIYTIWGIVSFLLLPESLYYTINSVLFFASDPSVLRCGIMNNNPPLPTPVLFIGFIIVTLYLGWFYYLYYIARGVSDPGPPREHKIDRYPKWPNRNIPLPSTTKFQYVQSKTSHTVTDYIFRGTAGCLTGEADGRDIWIPQSIVQTATGNSPSKTKVDDKLIYQLASSGRDSDDKQPVPFGTFNPSINPNSCDMIVREQLIRNYISENKGIPPNPKTKATTIDDVIKKAVQFYSMLLSDDGHWTGDYGGPHFLLPGLIIVWYIMGKPSSVFDNDSIELMKHYMIVHQQTDGGWGTHIESPSTMFGTTMQYVALRLLGMDANDPVCVHGRKFIIENGGAIMTASWAKFYLCLLGCMEWSGHNSVPAELWMLPNWFPFHPGRMWCHARMVYLPMGYLYGIRFVYPNAVTDPLIQQLRTELYTTPYNKIQWDSTRFMVAPMDNYSPIPWVMKFIQNILAIYETLTLIQPFKNYIRKKGLVFSLEYMAAEDLQTNYICIGPVNKILNMLSAYHAANYDIAHPSVTNHLMRISDYMWVAEDGMKMKGYNGSQCWDTSFAVQAMYEANALQDYPTIATSVWNFLERTQILSTEVSQVTAAYQYESGPFRKLYYRHLSEGGWPFSTGAHGWPISDCSGEGLKGVLCLLKSKAVQDGMKKGKLGIIDEDRLYKAIDVILAYQNEDGGFATYENNRGYGWYELLNPSEVFGDIMIDYSYVECSMASLTALYEYQQEFPNNPRSAHIEHSLEKGRAFLKSIQRSDGSWYGNWACCFTYAIWFGIEGLVKCGEPTNSDSIQRACQFLVQQQRPNGGWGEDFTSCYNKSYAVNGMEAYGDEHGASVVNTGWALLALAATKYHDTAVIQRGVQYLIERQLPTGDWPQEGIAGVFNRACGISYTNYRNIFPIWALGRCRTVYGIAALEKEEK